MGLWEHADYYDTRGKTPLYNASVKGDIHLHMTVYMWGLRGRYFLTNFMSSELMYHGC